MKEYYIIRDEIDRFLMRQDVISDNAIISAYDLKNILSQFFNDIDEYESITKGNEVEMINKNLRCDKFETALVNFSKLKENTIPKMLNSICYGRDKGTNVVHIIFNFKEGSINISNPSGGIKPLEKELDNITSEFAERFVQKHIDLINNKINILEKYLKVFDMNVSSFGLNYVTQRSFTDLFCVTLVAANIDKPKITFNPGNEMIKPQKLNLIEEDLMCRYIYKHSDDILKKTEISRKDLDPRFAMILSNYEQQIHTDSKVKAK